MTFDRVLITGGAGFIGSRLANKLVEAGATVQIFDNFHPQVHGDTPDLSNLHSDISVVRGDVCDKTALIQAIKDFDPDLLYHLAAETGTGQSYDEPTRYCDVNVLGTTNIVEALRLLPKKKRRIVLAGSRAVYGEGAYADTDGKILIGPTRQTENLKEGRFGVYDANNNALRPVSTPETLQPTPSSIYASTKLMQEYILQQCAAEGDYELGLLRFQNVYGPGQSLRNPYTGVLSIFSTQILNGEHLNIYEDGDIVRDFIFVDDVVRALLLCRTASTLPDGPINIGSGEAASILNSAKILLMHLTGSDTNLKITGKFRPGDIRYAVADISQAQATINWSPEISLETGLKALADWAKATHTS